MNDKLSVSGKVLCGTLNSKFLKKILDAKDEVFDILYDTTYNELKEKIGGVEPSTQEQILKKIYQDDFLRGKLFDIFGREDEAVQAFEKLTSGVYEDFKQESSLFVGKHFLEKRDFKEAFFYLKIALKGPSKSYSDEAAHLLVWNSGGSGEATSLYN